MANFNWTFVDVDGVLAVTSISASSFISASTFHGDGSGLTGVGGAVITSYTNPSNNRVVTSVDSNTVNSEANLTFDGSKLSATGQISASLGVTGSSLHTANTVINSTHISSSLNISGAAFFGNGSGLTGVGGDVVSDTTPQLGGDLDVNGHDIVSVSNGNISILPNGAGKVILDGNGSAAGISISDGVIEMRSGTGSPAKIDLYCESSNAHKVILSAPPHSAFSGDVDFVLPPTEGTNGQVLITDGNGVTSWANSSGGSSTAITGAFTANYNVLSSYDVMTVNTSGSVVTASLLAASSYSAGQRLVFKDVAGSGSTNNVVIKPSGSQTIDSGTSLKIQVNYGAVTIVSDGASTFHIIGVN
tara:strand:+ start:1736 stop:2815 length:1080 start_codon:yes stop_codon:yes gene_type:complete